MGPVIWQLAIRDAVLVEWLNAANVNKSIVLGRNSKCWYFSFQVASFRFEKGGRRFYAASLVAQ